MDAFRRLVDYIIILHTNTINKAFVAAASPYSLFHEEVLMSRYDIRTKMALAQIE